MTPGLTEEVLRQAEDMMTDMQARAFTLIDGWREEMLLFWEQLVNMESWSWAKDDVDNVAAFLKSSIERFGGQTELLEYPEAGNSLAAAFGQPTAKAPVCFMGHFDTVLPTGTTRERPFMIENGKAYGPGVLDMKAGVVIQLFAARALLEAGYSDRQIKVLLAGDEENMHPRSPMAAEFVERSRGAAAAFNFETGDITDTLVIGRKGSYSFGMTTKGLSVHAGREPQNGRSAIREMAHKVIDIEALNDFTAGITFNVGVFKGGFTRNAIPDHAEIEIDVRIMRNDQLAHVEERLKEITEKTYIQGVTTTLSKGGCMAPMEKTRGNEALFAHVKATAESIGQRVTQPIVSGGASDSAYSVLAGVPTIDQMGARGQWNHSDREYALVESLFERAKLAAACVLDIDSFARQ